MPCETFWVQEKRLDSLTELKCNKQMMRSNLKVGKCICKRKHSLTNWWLTNHRVPQGSVLGLEYF